MEFPLTLTILSPLVSHYVNKSKTRNEKEFIISYMDGIQSLIGKIKPMINNLKPHLYGRLFCNAIRRFFMRENLSRKVVTHTRRDSLATIAFGKNRRRVSNTCDL